MIFHPCTVNAGDERECKSGRADQFQTLPWSNTSVTRLLSGTMQVGLQFAIANNSVWGIQIAGLGKPNPAGGTIAR